MATSPFTNLRTDVVTVVSQCVCSDIQIRAILRHPIERIDCHCASCRKFHASAFVSFLPVEAFKLVRGDLDKILIYRDACSGIAPIPDASNECDADKKHLRLSTIDRLQCKNCSSKLMTTIVRNDGKNVSYINMGPLIEKGPRRFPPLNFPPMETREVGGPPVKWYLARPASPTKKTPLHSVYGRCSCGQTRYRTLIAETELQHCYCRLCRQYSGGPFMTWIPVEYLEWMDANGKLDPVGPPLVRTTEHGQRHFCSSCRSCLTIVYDDQPGFIWPVAASLDDETQLQLYSVMHISCRYRPRWYTIPIDGLPRVTEAGE